LFGLTASKYAIWKQMVISESDVTSDVTFTIARFINEKS
jgi:hypothetical protein